VLSLSSAALGQTDPAARNAALEANPFHLDPSGRGPLSVGFTEPLEHLQLTTFLVGQLAESPLIVRSIDTGLILRDLVESRWQVDLGAALGLYDDFEVGLTLPVVVSQSGQFPGLGMGEIASAGLSDPTFQVRGRIVSLEDFPIGVAVVLLTTVPIGDEEAYMGVDGLTLEPRLLFSTIVDRTTVSISAGYLLQQRNEIFTLTDDDKLTMQAGLSQDNELEGLDFSLVLLGHTNAAAPFEVDEETRLEAVFGIRLRLAESYILTTGAGTGLLRGVPSPLLRAFLGLGVDFSLAGPDHSLMDTDGDGLMDDVDQCLTEPEDLDGFEDEDGCPDDDNDADGILDDLDTCPDEPEDFDEFDDADGCPESDNDGDGIDDDIDACPLEPEDFDSFQDEDGCPEPDVDGDGIDDVIDECPEVPEDPDGFEDEDGCPEEGPLAALRDTHIAISQQIHFRHDSSVFIEDGYAVMDAVLQVLQENPGTYVHIRGHTDSTGSAHYNQRLSARRARAVRTYLIENGRPEDNLDERLEAIGVGEGESVADESTWPGRYANRRVEFLVVGTRPQPPDE
jgi:outer membrane protein OmpA-like peptidoglycan-associated protein